MRAASVVGSAVTFATTGTLGVPITTSAIAAANFSAAGFINEQWNGALTASTPRDAGDAGSLGGAAGNPPTRTPLR